MPRKERLHRYEPEAARIPSLETDHICLSETEMQGNFVDLEQVFGLIYHNLPPDLYPLFQKILYTEIETLAQKGISTAWVRSGARQLGIMLAENYGYSEELQKRWGVFNPGHQPKSEELRNHLVNLKKLFARLENQDKNILFGKVRAIFSEIADLPDMDIKAYITGPNKSVDVDAEVGRFIDQAVKPHIDYKPHVTHSVGRTEWRAQYNEDYHYVLGESGTIPGTQRKNAAVTFYARNNRTLFGAQIGTIGETTEDILTDNRNNTSNFSIEDLALPLKAVNGRILVDLSGLPEWYKSLGRKIALGRNIQYTPPREAIIALRSGRIFTHMQPVANELQGLVSEFYTQDALEKMRKTFAMLTFERDKLTRVEFKTILTEFIAMIGADPYAGFVWAIETGAAKYFFGDKGQAILIDRLLSERMLADPVESSSTHIVGRQVKHESYSSYKSLAAKRTQFLESSTSGLRLAYDSLVMRFNIGKDLSLEEFIDMIDMLSKKYPTEITENLIPESYMNQTIIPSVLKYVRKNRKKVRKMRSIANMKLLSQDIRFINQIASRNQPFTYEELQIAISHQVQSGHQQIFEYSSVDSYCAERKMILLLFGIISQWQPGNEDYYPTYVITPIRLMKKILTDLENE